MESYHKADAREKCAHLITTIINCTVPTVDHEVCLVSLVSLLMALSSDWSVLANTIVIGQC